MNMLSEIVQNMVPSGTLEINARVFEMRQNGEEIINLSVGEPDFNTPSDAKMGGIQAIAENRQIGRAHV